MIELSFSLIKSNKFIFVVRKGVFGLRKKNSCILKIMHKIYFFSSCYLITYFVSTSTLMIYWNLFQERRMSTLRVYFSLHSGELIYISLVNTFLIIKSACGHLCALFKAVISHYKFKVHLRLLLYHLFIVHVWKGHFPQPIAMVGNCFDWNCLNWFPANMSRAQISNWMLNRTNQHPPFHIVVTCIQSKRI